MKDKIEATINIKPISTNRLYQGRRYRTKNYKDWMDFAIISTPKKKMIKDKVSVFLDFYYRYAARSDIDNFLKGVLDMLCKKGWIEDDRFIYFLQVRKFIVKTEKEEKIKVKIVKL